MLLDDIIGILSDENGSLNNALLKTKVLLHTIGKKDLVPWVDNELRGYPDDDSVPEYRRVDAYVFGQVQSFTQVHHHYLVPLMHLDEDLRKRLTEFQLLLPIDQIQQAVAQHRAGLKKTLGKPIPPEICAILSEGLQSAHVITAKSELNMNQADNILQEVRSRLLDFTLELRDVVGIEATNKDLASKAANVDTEKLFNTAVYGTGNTIIIGSHTFQAVTNEKDDIDGLLAAVSRLGFQQGELEGLRQALLEDRTHGKTPDVTEGATGRWYTKALKEAGKGAVKAGIDVVSSVVIKAIKAYTTGEP